MSSKKISVKDSSNLTVRKIMTIELLFWIDITTEAAAEEQNPDTFDPSVSLRGE